MTINPSLPSRHRCLLSALSHNYSFESLAARALPPFKPPLRLRAIVAGFFFSAGFYLDACPCGCPMPSESARSRSAASCLLMG